MNESKLIPNLPEEEPIITDWKTLDDKALQVLLKEHLPDRQTLLILIDGRSGSGKTTFAEKTSKLLNAAIVHTDDVAWHLDPINWDEVLLKGIIEPWSKGQNVAYKPPGWIEKGREGMIEAQALPILVVEGVGAGRESLANQADLIVWVQSDIDSARARGIERDIAEEGRSPKEAERFWDEWLLSEQPFLATDRPWSRAQLIVNGTPKNSGKGNTVVADGLI